MGDPGPRRRSRGWTRATSWLLLPLASLLALTLLLELGLRSFPALLPRGIYGSKRFEPAINSHVFAGETVRYHKIRYTERRPNADGFLDVELARAKRPDVVRVGFFGDSTVEALQVPIEQTFWRRLPARLGDAELETLAFGISGWGTLHSLLAYREYGRRYDLDLVVYVFYRNDPGDDLDAIQRAQDATPPRPTARLSDSPDGFEIRWIPARSPKPPAEPVWGRSRLYEVVRLRSALLGRQRGYRRAAESGVPAQDAPPSTWPPALLRDARELSRRLLRRFAADVREDRRHFMVFFNPTGNWEISGGMPVEDSWYPWLERTCAELDIPLIDPRPEMRTLLDSGVDVFDDHWSPAGHGVVAELLERRLATELAHRTASQPASCGSPPCP